MGSGPENSFSQGGPQNDAFLPGKSSLGASKIRGEGGDEMKKASALQSKWRGRLMKFTTEDLLALERELRKLQEPHGRVFWLLEQLAARIADELDRRAT